jgi:adenylate cyclase, class 2
MGHINVEIKARSTNQDFVRKVLKDRNAEYKGTDHQIDTYFVVPQGRLKLREGNIENALIYYEREETTGTKESKIILYPFDPSSKLKEILMNVHEVLVVVDKQREIFFIDNIKFHIDTVASLGTFIEIEARDYEGNIGREKLQQQCTEYMKLFGIAEADLVQASYSDLLLRHCHESHGAPSH